MNIPKFKIVGITAHFSKTFKDKSLKAGMDEFYGKPLYANVLNQILN